MGLYSSKNSISYGTGAMAIDLDTVEESKFDSFDEAAIMAVVESEQNYNALMKAVGIAELNYLEENGTELVYTEGTVSGFFAKVKEFFKKIIAKIASILKAFFAKIDSFTKSDKDFLNKYRKDLTRLNLKDMTVNGYKFTNLDKFATKNAEEITSLIKDVVKASSADITKLAETTDEALCDTIISADDDDLYEDFLEDYRGILIHQSNIDGNEFSKELYEYFRNGESSKEEIDVDIVHEMQVLAKYADAKKNAEKSFKNIESACNVIIKSLDKAESHLLKEKSKETDKMTIQGKRVRAVNVVIKLMRGAMGVNSTYFGAYLQALKDESRQAKAICVKALTYKPKNESAGVEYGTTGSFLENVEFN